MWTYNLRFQTYESYKLRKGKIQYISKLSLVVSIMIPIYIFATIIYPYSYIDYLLPTVNLLVWY